MMPAAAAGRDSPLGSFLPSTKGLRRAAGQCGLWIWMFGAVDVSVAVAFVGAGLGVKPRPVFGPAVRPHFLFPGFRACFSELLGISRTAPDRKTLREVAPSVTPRAARQTQYFPVFQPPHLVIRFLQMDGRKNIRL